MERPIAVVAGLLAITLNVVIPVFLIAAIGFAARRAMDLDPRPITRLTLYVFVPSLIFNSLLTTQMSGAEITRIGVFAIALAIAMIAVGAIASRLFRLTRSESSGFTLSITFMNAANYGLPVALFAFGQDGFDRAVVFSTFAQILTFTLAVFVAARGKLAWQKAILPILKIPVIWAAIAALLIRALGLDLPLVIQRAATLLAGGTIPTIILLLGIQVAGMQVRKVGPLVLGASAMRLILAPGIALLLVALLQPSEITGKILVLEAAMPTAVNVTLLAAEFDAEPELVSSVALLTTAVSIVTVTGWVAYLQGL